MENLNPNQWSEVKKIKFHHRVKRFYHKDLFRKIYTVAIIGLIGANVFSLVKYYSVADELEMLDDTQPVVQDTSENDAEGEDENLLTDIDNDLQSGDMDDVFSGDTEDILSGDIEQILTGDVLSGDVENTLTGDIQEDSSLHSEGQDDVEQPLSPQQASDSSPSREQNSEGEDFSPDRGSGEAEGVNNTPMDSSSSSESQTLTKAQELQKAWETLNTGHIAGSSTYNGLRVSVNAPEGAFPQGTKLVIKPIDKGSKESVSFDISFIYTYSDGSTIELQPLKGKSVQVIFNYDENIEWKNAVSKGQELKVKHKHNGDTEDVKFSNNGEGNLMIDTDKFSEYEFSLVKPTDIQTQGQEDTQNDTKVEELTGTALELATARETLNLDPIEKSEKYNKVTVNVLAPANTFPEGTKLVIEAIKGDKLEEVRQQIADEPTNNIDEDAEIVAFDIRFEYELSDGSIVELQPKENTVQVTFDYSNNKELKKADQNENEEIEIYHINDKDENGQKVAEGEEVVEKIEINEEKSDELENGVVIDAESFSYYTIVVQRREEAPESAPTQTWQYGEDYFTINIARPSSYSVTDYPIEGFTIMDRNLGASISGTTCDTSNNTGACGYLYQWGNNYGFPISANASSILTGVGLTWDDSYNNNGYVSKKFVNGSSFDYDVWSDSTHHDGIWGGANDVNFSSSKNTVNKLYWDDGGDRNLRQGPCPEGWHVPSAGEWSMLLDYWYYTNYSSHPSVSSKLYYFSDFTKRQAFMDYFYIPFAGDRSRSSASLYDQGSIGFYWSSSPSSAGSSYARVLYLNSSNVLANYNDLRAIGFSVRCFKDSYVASPDTSNLTDTQAWVEGKDFETITISNPENSNEGFTIMDRNLGATATGYGASASADSYGFKYQWGNNFGFRDSDSVTAVTAGLTYNSIYDNHGYYSTNFINGSSHDYDVWDGTNPTANGKEHHDGLWGGANDSSSNNRGANQTNPTDRQGPCPVGYHVPSAGEWGLLIKYWADTKDNGTTKNATYGGSTGLYYLNSNYSAFQQKFNLPFAGRRDYSDASLYDQGSFGYYWSSSPYGSDFPVGARNLYLDSSDVGANYSYYRAFGFSVRCFKDEYDMPPQPVTVTFNANGGEITTGSVQVSDGTSLDLTQYTATKTDYEFIGWNTDSGATTKIEDSYLVNGDITLYAIFKKLPNIWTIESGDFGALDITGTDGKVLFTIMDRNLGAEAYMNEDGKTASQWYGKYYQWGNNYGFTNDGNITVDDSQVDASEYGPNNYYSSSTFITAYSDWSLVNNKNLWGGSGDSVSNRGPGTDEDRQGPCPSGYHVPDILEWKAATKTWCKEKMGQADGQCNNGDNFRDDLLLPFAGYRDRYGAGVYGQGSYGYYWSSSPYPSNSSISYYLDFSSSHMYADSYGSRAYGYSVRCFKNTTGKTITYVLNNGTNNPSNPDSTVRRWEEGTPLLSGTRAGYTFKGWYTNPDFTGDAVTTNAITDNSDSDTITLYAKWEKDPSAWTIESGDFYPLTVSGGGISFTIMDRNLGAEDVAQGLHKDDNGGNAESLNKLGYYYQWGNNYGFPNTGSVNSISTRVDITAGHYGPGNYYNSGTFVSYGSRWDIDTSNDKYSQYGNQNLWGGEGDTVSDRGPGTDADRQGPCPSGYHVPSIVEWQKAYNIWNSTGAIITYSGNVTTAKAGNKGSNAKNFAYDLKLPFAGYRSYGTDVYYQGNSGNYYVSSSPTPSSSFMSYNLNFDSSNINPQYYKFYRAQGLSVRCFQNTTGKTLIYMLDGGNNDTNNPNSTARRWENGTKLLSGTRDGSIFKGWYTTSGFEEGTKVTTNAITDNSDSDTITLYAKWEKTPRAWTIESGDFRALDITGIDGKVLFTIMDRNLGAEAYMNESGKTASQWYGKYYQWGNNYGFPNTGSITTNGNRVDITAGHYGPNNYYSSSTFIKRSTSPYSWDIDTSNDTYTQYGNLNLWGGENTSNPDSRRQGPCPSGYHVPDSLEWKAAVTVWCTKKRGGANDTACNSQGTQLQTDLLLPFAGRRYYYNANINYQGIYGSYRSSSPNSSNFNNYSYGFDLDSSGIGPQDNYYRVYGFPVRCFKNTTGKTITYVLNSGNNNPSNPTTSVRRWEDGTTLLNATRDGYTFIGWYTTPGFEEGTRVTTNAIIDNSNSDTITLYAKWGKNPRDWTIESGDFRALDVTGTDGKVLFTIMDRNLGAIQAGTGENSYGYFYQRGNNYGFANIGSVTTSGSQVDTSGYGPDNYYSSSTFITGHSGWSSVNNENLWGGEKVYNSDVDRQGPCPAGYHVPDMFEWKAAREIWCREKMGQTNGQCNNGGKFRDDLLLPFAGYRGIYNASIYNQGSNGYYWSSSPHTSYADDSYYLYFNSSQININLNSYTSHANGSSVRCFKNSQSTQTLTFDADNGEDNVVYNIRWWEPITKSHKFTPEKKGYKFVGWYEGNTEFNFSDTTFIAKDTILKAKWEKTPWYTYNSNGGEFNSGNSIVVVKSDGNLTLDITNKQNRYEVYDNVIKFTGANGIHFEGTFSPSCSNTINFYKYDRTKTDEGEIMPSPLNWQYMTFNFDLEGDTLTIETLGGNVGSIQNCPALLYDGTATTIGYIIKNLEEIPSRTGYAFSGWYETGDNRPFNFTGTEVTQDRTLYAKWNPNHYTIQLDINEGTGEVSDINATYGEEITLPIVTREGYTFKGWQSEDGLLYSDVIPEGTPLTTQDGAIVILTAQWESDQEPSNNNYSGGGRKNSSSDSDSETHSSADEKDSVEKSEDSSLDENTSSKNESPKLQELDMKKYDNNYPEEQNQAYQFAYKNGITTQSTIKSARMNTELTRIQMAKMLSNYAINIMGQEPDLSKGMIKFNDVPSKLDLQYDNAVTKAYQLGIMGQNMKNNEFRPNDKVTRAEFATALSRLLYKTEEGKYKGTGKYYEPHIAKLYNEGIISKTDPSIKEKRGYVMTMLMRTVK